MVRDIVIIGSGNVAWHLGKALFENGFNIQEVAGRNPVATNALAMRLGANAIFKIEEISRSAQLYIIAVNDDSIVDVCNELPDLDGIIVHTSGSTGFEALMKFKRYGVLYPFQTLTKDKVINYKEVQFLIEGNTNDVTEILKLLASDISNKVMETTFDQRKQLHIAAIFASNFVNHFYFIANSFLKEKNLSFDLLMPLIEETTDKIRHIDPKVAQTGPAIRGDQAIIDKHLEVLKDNPDYQLFYELLTKSIQKAK